MENKEIKITVPEGYEIDRANSSFECIKFKKKELAYKDVCRALFLDKDAYYIRTLGSVDHMVARGDDVYGPNNAISKHQLDQLLAINKLMNVAVYLNKIPLDWDNLTQGKWYIYYYHPNNDLRVASNYNCRITSIYFDSEEHARQAVEILGEDVVKLALGVFD